MDAIVDGKWRDAGMPLSKLVKDAPANERVLYALPIEDALPKGNLMFFSRLGMVKKTAWS